MARDAPTARRLVVRAAHVSVPAPATNGAIWRVVGSPLVAPSNSAGATCGTLKGATVAVKDLYEVKGFAVGAGVPAYLAESPIASGNATAVQQLLFGPGHEAVTSGRVALRTSGGGKPPIVQRFIALRRSAMPANPYPWPWLRSWNQHLAQVRERPDHARPVVPRDLLEVCKG